MWFEMTGPRPMQPLLFLLLGDGVGSGACCNHGCRSQRKVRFVRCVTFIGFAAVAAAVTCTVGGGDLCGGRLDGELIKILSAGVTAVTWLK